MNKILGLGVSGLSVVLAAIVSGLRLKPYVDAGETYTPPTFALYPALIAVALTVPAVFILRKWQGKTDVDIGPVTFTNKQPFLVLGCLLYVLVALLFFPYQKPPPLPFPAQPHRPEKSVTPRQPVRVPLLFR